MGAKGVNNLASKILLILFPPGGSFFRLTVDDFTLSKLLGSAADAGEQEKDVRAEIEAAFGKVERAAVQRLEERGARMQLFESCKHLLVTGNSLLQMLPDERLKLHRLDKYVVKRDKQGNVTEIVVKETVAKVTLPEHIRKLIDSNPATELEKGNPSEAVVDIYTHIRREKNGWSEYQEVNGVHIPDTDGTYPLDKSPWIPLRFVAVDGEDYGRGFVEEVLGDLRSLDSLRQAIVEGAAISARMTPLVDEGGVTEIEDLVKARNGEPIHGKASDVSFLQVDKFADLRVAMETSQEIKRDLQQSFLLLTGVQRNAERVTAEEFRMLAQELEGAFGGAYSVLSQELQLPVAKRLLFQMERRKQLPKIPAETVSLQIVTGIAGLGRNSDLNKLDILLGGVQQMFGPEALSEYVSAGSYIKRRATALAIDVDGMIRSDEQVTERRNQQAQMELAKSAIGPVSKLAGDQMAASQQTQQ